VPEAAASLKISNIPTFVLFKGGKEVGRVSGANPKALEGAIKEHV
jgi:thioredoxin 1